jgi:hypothetical protein
MGAVKVNPRATEMKVWGIVEGETHFERYRLGAQISNLWLMAANGFLIGPGDTAKRLN